MALLHGTVRSLSLHKIIVLVLLFTTFKIDSNFCNDGSFLLIARKLNYMQYPSRNSTLWHQQHRGPTLPSPLKTLAGLHTLNASLCASLILTLLKIHAFCVRRDVGATKKRFSVMTVITGIMLNVLAWTTVNTPILYLTLLRIGFAQCAFALSLHMHLSDMDDDCPRSSSTLHEANNQEIRMFRVFKVGYLNVNRLLNKLDSVKELIDKYSSDILALSKIWLTSEISDSEISIMGYSIVRKDRQNSSKACGGGVLIYVRNGIPFIRQAKFVDDNFECFWIEINWRFCKPMAVGVVYRPGYMKIEDFIKALWHIVWIIQTWIKLKQSSLVIFMLITQQKNPLLCRLDEFALSFNLTLIISKPTRVTATSKSTIDLILVNNNNKIVQCDVLNSGISDLNAIFCVRKGGLKKLLLKVLSVF